MNPTTLDIMAKRNFVLPAAIVLSVHAALLFGVIKSPQVSSSRSVYKPATRTGEVPISIASDPQENKGDPSPSSGGPAQPRLPEIPNPISSEPNPITVSVPPGPVDISANVTVVNPWPGDSPRVGIGPGTGVIEAASLDHLPQVIVQSAPVYPSDAKTDGRNGQVVVEFMVDESGQVYDPRVVSSSDRAFEEPTLRAVEKWRFAPGTRHGLPVRFRMSVPVTFNLDG